MEIGINKDIKKMCAHTSIKKLTNEHFFKTILNKKKTNNNEK